MRSSRRVRDGRLHVSKATELYNINAKYDPLSKIYIINFLLVVAQRGGGYFKRCGCTKGGGGILSGVVLA